ncbi:MAG: ribbon-helix-helix protein, CopG family [Myxococcales bacterium]|nr:ribbon-helix-helix protein, CopG family [Myxococcales bacterium]
MGSSEVSRTRQQSMLVRLNEDERAMIEELARRQGLNLSDALRQAVRRDAERLGVAPKTRRVKR